MESIFIDYFHVEAADAIEMAAFQARHNQFNTMADQINDERGRATARFREETKNKKGRFVLVVK